MSSSRLPNEISDYSNRAVLHYRIASGAQFRSSLACRRKHSRQIIPQALKPVALALGAFSLPNAEGPSVRSPCYPTAFWLSWLLVDESVDAAKPQPPANPQPPGPSLCPPACPVRGLPRRGNACSTLALLTLGLESACLPARCRVDA